MPADILFERSGPRELIFFEPRKTTGGDRHLRWAVSRLNNVIRSAYVELHESYAVMEVWGIRYGYAGLNAGLGESPIRFTASLVTKFTRSAAPCVERHVDRNRSKRW